jgi:hypothetical protein
MLDTPPQVIQLLETYLDAARKHPIGHIAIAAVGYPNIIACDFAGDVALESTEIEAADYLLGRLHKSVADWAPPTHDATLDHSYVCYNLRSGPQGYDFIIWLVDQEMKRQRAGAPAPLKVGFWFGKSGRIADLTRMWLENLFRPALKLVGAVEDDKAVFGHRRYVYVPKEIVKAAKEGQPTPVFRASVPAPFPGAVTITLRETSHDAARNSNFAAWEEFADHLKGQGEQVVFVRDTEKAHEPIYGFQTCPAASVDLDSRVALYEGAKINLFVANGPSCLAEFGKRPLLKVCKTAAFARLWAQAMGIDEGEQFPWSLPTQRMIWKEDTFENLVQAWNELKPLMEIQTQCHAA